MTQIRYNDYRTPIGSKRTMEPLALTVGIGPQFGFDKVDYIESTPNVLSIVIDSENSNTVGTSPVRRDHYITDESNNMIRPRHGVTTPDGIFTMIPGLINLKEDVTGLPVHKLKPYQKDVVGNYVELLLVASHYYVPDPSVASPVTLSIIKNTTQAPYYWAIYNKPNEDGYHPDEISQDLKHLGNWYSFSVGQQVDRSTQVIVALLMINRDNPAESFGICPYHYQWPQPLPVSSEYMYNFEGYTKKLIKNVENKITNDVKSTLAGAIKQLIFGQVLFGNSVLQNTPRSFELIENGTINTILGPGRMAQVNLEFKVVRNAQTSPYDMELVFKTADIFNYQGILNVFNTDLTTHTYPDQQVTAFTDAIGNMAQFNKGMAVFDQTVSTGTAPFRRTAPANVIVTVTKGTSIATNFVRFRVLALDNTYFHIDTTNHITVRCQMIIRF